MTLSTPKMVPNGAIYTDSKGLHALRAKSAEDPQGTLRQVAEQFEAIFVQLMLKNMRDAKLADGLFDSDATRQYQDLHDKQLGLNLGAPKQAGGSSLLGIADMLMRQLGGAAGGESQPAPAPVPGPAPAAPVNNTLAGLARYRDTGAPTAAAPAVASTTPQAAQTGLGQYWAAVAGLPRSEAAVVLTPGEAQALDATDGEQSAHALADGTDTPAVGAALIDGNSAAEAAHDGQAASAVQSLLAGANPFASAASVPADAMRAEALAALQRFAPPVGATTAPLPAVLAPAPAAQPARNADTVASLPPVQVPAQSPHRASSAPARTHAATPQVQRFESPQHFITELWDDATAAASELGVKPEVLLAQAALETGWGKHMPRHPDGSTSHNLFGIKATSRWHGERVEQMTLEYENGQFERRADGFRAYDDYASSFKDYVNLIKGASRYRNALAKVDDPGAYYQELQRAGYATDPGYAGKLTRILAGDAMRDAMASRMLAANAVRSDSAAG